jgi:hypothetical protein
VAALAADTRPPLPELHASLLRGPLHRVGMRCALLGCGAGSQPDGRPLLRCSGGCQGLARYCGAAHQKRDWASHKTFCKRSGSAADAAGGSGARARRP